MSSGTVYRWRTEAEREEAEERALRAEERRRLAQEEAGRATSGKSRTRPVTTSHVWLALGGLGAVVLGFVVQLVGGEAGWCVAKHPDSMGSNFESCSYILANASAFEVIAGHLWGWVLLAGIVSLLAAAVLWVRHHIAPGERAQFVAVILLVVSTVGGKARGSSSSAQRWRAPPGGGYGGDGGADW
ncbi:hypothetical protein OG949_41080 (plasmid) [Streptomyces scopuliridis]|uniref:hypothetical protein n=1 Tax=Streptomyces scopuliridis TaxID=452529 RepID=UPI002DDC46C8|nr:hypothetical protein [Streptomyces scopuliridis]WSB39137.1 hypothetical protein OG949_41080 [Streptomyces scopuliridis]